VGDLTDLNWSPWLARSIGYAAAAAPSARVPHDLLQPLVQSNHRRMTAT
jgi:hypothetical protein